MNRRTCLLCITASVVLIPAFVFGGPAAIDHVKDAEVLSNLGTAFGGFAGGAVALLGFFYTWKRSRNKDARERDERLAKEAEQRKKDKEDRDARWVMFMEHTNQQLAEHAATHTEIRDEVKEIGQDVREMGRTFVNFLSSQATGRHNEQAGG
jgi:gas vesicle protein